MNNRLIVDTLLSWICIRLDWVWAGKTTKVLRTVILLYSVVLSTNRQLYD